MWSLLACPAPEAPTSGPLTGTVADGAMPDLVHGWTFSVELSAASPLALVCTSPDDPEEHHDQALPSGTRHEVALYGLLADTTYRCTLSADGWSDTRTFTTGPLPDWLPSWTVEAGPGAGSGYTLLNHGTDRADRREPKLLVVDPEGRLRWSYLPPFPDATDLDAQYLGDGQILYGGGYSAPPTIIDLGGAVLSQAGPSSTGLVYHHHAERIATGEVATLTVAPNTDGQQRWTGFAVDLLAPDLQTRTWTWNSQRGVDEGWLPARTDRDDAYHANALVVDDDRVYVNLRELGVLIALDRATGDHRFTLGPDQDFVLLDAAGDPADPTDWFRQPHAPEKDGDRFLFYDNGDLTRPYSRISEFVVDEAARTATLEWTFTEPGWIEPIWGDVDRLPDGHVLFVRAHCEWCGTGSGRTEIVEVDPTTDAVVWRMTFADDHDGGYRAERIDGCALFANRRYCSDTPATLSREPPD